MVIGKLKRLAMALLYPADGSLKHSFVVYEA